MPRIVLSFATIHDALAAERTFLALGDATAADRVMERAELLPLPPSIKSDCGFGLYIDTHSDEATACLALLRGASVRWEAAYRVAPTEAAGTIHKERIYERID